MKKIIYDSLFIALLMMGCQSEKDAAPAKEKTFIRYFGTENNQRAVLAVEVEDGFALLSTTEIQRGPAQVEYKIRLTKVDSYGNLSWDYTYPEFSEQGQSPSVKPASFVALNSGYLIIGDSINSSGTTKVQLVQVDPQGAVLKYKTISGGAATESLHGRAVVMDASGDVVILAGVEGDPFNNMLIAKLDPETFEVKWSRKYGAGESQLISRLFSTSGQSYFWAGSVKDNTSSKYNFRLIHAPENSQTVFVGSPIGDENYDETANDFCQSLGGWVLVGSTNESGTKDMLVIKLSSASNVLYQKRFDGLPQQDEEAVSITGLRDGALALLGTAGVPGRSTDLILMKTDASGNSLWQRYYGTADQQIAASVRETSDGSLLIFATTSFGDEKKLMLLKVNEEGEF